MGKLIGSDLVCAPDKDAAADRVRGWLVEKQYKRGISIDSFTGGGGGVCSRHANTAEQISL